MGSWTVTETITAVREALIDPSPGDRYKDADILAGINTAGRQLNPIILRLEPRVLRRTVDISYVASTAAYSIPVRIGKLLAVERMTATGYPDYNMLPIQADELFGYSRAGRGDFYLLGQNTITIDPTPTTTQTSAIRIHYAPTFLPVHTGTAQGGAATSITFAATATLGTVSTTDDVYIGSTVRGTNNSPTGVLGQEGTVTDYVGSTKVATVGAAWTTNPTSATTYEVVLEIPDGAQDALIFMACEAIAALRDTDKVDYFAAKKREAVNAMTAALNTYMPGDTGLILIDNWHFVF